MDPNDALNGLLEALEDGELLEAREFAESLLTWGRAGGYFSQISNQQSRELLEHVSSLIQTALWAQGEE